MTRIRSNDMHQTTGGFEMGQPNRATDELLSTSEVLKRLSIGETTLWRMEKRGEFPKPIVLGRRCKRWRSSDIENFIEGKLGAA